ncbi:MAG: serine hydrolase [Chitinophagaceae bacterium]
MSNTFAMNKKIFLLLWLLAACIVLQAQSTVEKLNELLTANVTAGKFNGSVLVAQKGKVLLEKGYGKKDVKAGTFNDSVTIYQVGSVTKQFTAALILWLQEQKKLSVTDKLSKYFPGYPQGDKITIENLLTHTSGVHNYTDSAGFMQTEITKPVTSDKMIAMFRSWPLDFEPGTQWNYSNSGYSLLGYIIEKITGKPYETLMHQVILGPVGMEHSGFDFKHLQSADKATGYLTLTKTGGMPAPIVDSSVSFSAGALYTTVGDLYRWDRAINSNKIVKAASWQKAFTPYKQNYGYGWMIDSLYGTPRIHHGGGIHGFNSNIARFPSEDVTIILISNVNTPLLESLTRDIAAILFNKPYTLPKEKVAITVPENVLQQYVGVYELAPTFKITVTLESGALKAQATGQPKFDLFAETNENFFLKVVDAQITFTKDANGKVEQLILHQNGRDMPGKKVE